jgi:hypothetical protein
MSAYRIFILVLLSSATGCGGCIMIIPEIQGICVCDSADKIVPAG